MTEKLYYKDSYMKEFSATVLSCESCEGGFRIALDKTAFFPEQGGQYSDRGVLGDVRVMNAIEDGGAIYHITDAPLTVGEVVEGVIDFDERYEKMQLHSAEHILSGLIHSAYGYNNVGFHLGADEVTMDISAPLSREDLLFVEERANEIVYENVEIKELYPKPEELSALEYRSKLDLTENVRIIAIGEYDRCACCAPHVKRTGEIGSIKILDFASLRGGIRIRITAGKRAYFAYRDMFANLAVISHAMSVPKSECAKAVLKYVSDAENAKSELKLFRRAFYEREAEFFTPSGKNDVLVYPGATIEELRAFANKAMDKSSGILVLLSPTEQDIKYIIASKATDLKAEIKKINTALDGRGGGNSIMAQGSFKASLDAVKDYFSQPK